MNKELLVIAAAVVLLAGAAARASAQRLDQADDPPRASAQPASRSETTGRASAQPASRTDATGGASAQLLEVGADESFESTLYSSVDTREWQPPTLYAPTAVKVEDNPKGVRPGMTLISIDGLDILAPKGLRVEKRGSRVVYEDTGEFIARRFDEFDTAVAELKAQVASLQQELAAMKKTHEERSATP